MIATANSQTAIGVEGELVEVEARVSGREHGATIIVGLPDRAVTEARERVRAGVIASELWWPQGRVVVNLAPGNVPEARPASRPRDGGRDPGRQRSAAARAGGAACSCSASSPSTGALRPVHGALIAAETARRVGSRGARLPAGVRRRRRRSSRACPCTARAT